MASRFVLPNAVSAVGGLLFSSDVPPRIILDHGVGGGEGESGAAGFEADQENRCFTGLKALDEFAAVFRRAGEFEEGIAFLFQFARDEVEHLDKLRKDQNRAAFFNEIVEHLHQKEEFGGIVSGEIVIFV